MSDNRWCGNEEVLVSYLYDEIEGGERTAFEAHLQTCESCAHEVRAFSAVRSGLARWSPPDVALDFRIVSETSKKTSWLSWFTIPAMPVWAQLGAAAVLVGVAVGLSGLEVRYDSQGLMIRTGWQHQAAQAPAQQAAAVTPVTAPAQATTQAEMVPVSTSGTPWQRDLASVEDRLRRELRQSAAPGAAGASLVATRSRAMSDDEFLDRVRALITESESRQNHEMSLRLAQVVRDVDTQRRGDMVRMSDGLGVVEGRAVSAAAQQRQMIDYLMRVSSQRDPRQ
jgi:hypothetical protein